MPLGAQRLRREGVGGNLRPELQDGRQGSIEVKADLPLLRLGDRRNGPILCRAHLSLDRG